MKTESKIQAIREPVASYQARKDWAKITGQAVMAVPVYYRDKETGAEYSHIAGAIGWPEADKPGYGVIVAVGKSDEPNPPLHVLDEVEAGHPHQLLIECGTMRERWGFLDHSELLRLFSGDTGRFGSFVTGYNKQLTRKHGKNYGRLLIVSPPGYEDTSFFEGAVRQVQSLLTPDADGKKRLYLGQCDKIRNAIQSMDATGNMNQAAADSPSVLALACVISRLLVMEPWSGGSGAFNWPE